jgi:hypothetical protein
MASHRLGNPITPFVLEEGTQFDPALGGTRCEFDMIRIR